MNLPSNPSVVLTGASSGIGRATAIRFARSGARLVLAGRNPDTLESVAAECRAAGADVVVVPTDVSDWSAVKHLAVRAREAFGGIDVWVNNAGISVFAEFLEMPLEDFRRVIDVDLMGVVHGSRAALKAMQRQGAGVLINVSSVVGELPQPFTAPYGMAKAAVRALDVSLRSELALAKQKNIKVATIMPSTIDTPFFSHAGNYTGRAVRALPPVYSPEQVAKAIVKAASHPRAEVVVGNGGRAFVTMHRMAPRLADAQMAVQTNLTHLSLKEHAKDTTGILYEPVPKATAMSTGGWDGAGRQLRRRLVAWGLVAGGVALAGRTVAKGRNR
ncbi:MAG TPA: SDR family oxidoreductase [Pseudolysinimonas sp.]|nr:SDR family oxidoreductase [Pseudolysinimonas sp.]